MDMQQRQIPRLELVAMLDASHHCLKGDYADTDDNVVCLLTNSS